jgi:hypothetical protein
LAHNNGPYFSSFSLKVEYDKLANEKTEMQRHYVMVRISHYIQVQSLPGSTTLHVMVGKMCSYFPSDETVATLFVCRGNLSYIFWVHLRLLTHDHPCVVIVQKGTLGPPVIGGSVCVHL